MSTTAVLLILISSITHAGWNLILRSQRTTYTILRITGLVGIMGLGPALALEAWGQPFPTVIWGYLLITALFQAGYYLGLSKGYQSGHFSVVYPLARALPILMIAVSDVWRGHMPSLLGWVGMGMVSLGCFFIPLPSLRAFNVAHYRSPVLAWTLLAAFGTTGYSIIDNLAAEHNIPGPLTAARYGVFEFLLAAMLYWLVLKKMGLPTGDDLGWRGWRWSALAAVGLFGSYWLILWSYQFALHVSYVVTLRQFSIIIGVVLGVILFREPAPLLRIGNAVIIAMGIAFIAIGG